MKRTGKKMGNRGANWLKRVVACCMSVLILCSSVNLEVFAGNVPDMSDAQGSVSGNHAGKAYKQDSPKSGESNEGIDLDESAQESAESGINLDMDIESDKVGGNIPANPVHHCTQLDDGSDYTDWSYVYFGSYPQTEITDSATINAIDSAIATSGVMADAGIDVWVNGAKYRRISKDDTNYDGYFDEMPTNNGYRYFKWERIKWRVFDNNDNGTLFVVADSALDCKCYNDKQEDTTWDNSTIRSWLNNSFYGSAFSSGEQNAIVEQNVVNEDDPYYGAEGGNNTTDKIYLLSFREITNADYGFCSDDICYSASRWIQPSSYTRARGTLIGNDWSVYNNSTCCNWWLRSPGFSSDNAVNVDFTGGFELYCDDVSSSNHGIVPALHIDLSSNLWSMEDDNQVNPPNQPNPSTSYYDTEPKRLFRVMEINSTSYPSPSGFEVSVGADKFSSGNAAAYGTDDIDVNIPSNYTGDVKISKNGYFDCKIPAKYTGQYNIVTMTPTSVSTPFVQALLVDETKNGYVSYRNVLVEEETMYRRKLENNEVKEFSIYPQVEWNGHGAGEVWLEQGTVKVPLQNNVMNAFDWNTYFFSPNRKIYLCAKASDGTGFKAATKINVYERVDSGIKIDLGLPFTLDTAESKEEKMSIFSKQKLKFDLSKLSDGAIPCSISIKGDGTIEGVIGFQVDEEEETVAAYGKMVESIKQLWNMEDEDRAKKTAELVKYAKSKRDRTIRSGSFGVSGDMSVLGYVTGKIENGEVNFKECKVALTGEGQASYTYNTVIAAIPVYFKAALKAQIEWYMKLCSQGDTYGVSSDDGEYVDTTISLSLEAGPGWEGTLSGSPKAAGSIKISNKLPTDQNHTVCSIKADFSVKGTLKGVSGEWVFYSTPERIFWDGGWCWKGKDDKSASAETACFIPDLTTTEMKVGDSVYDEMPAAEMETVTVEDGDYFATGMNGYAAPTVARIGDKLLVVWSADVPGRSVVDSKGVYYSVCDNGTWTMPALVDDDGTNDSIPQLMIKDDTVYLAWQNYTEKFETDELPDFETISAQMENVVSVFDTESYAWSAPSVQTPEWYLASPEIPESYQKELPPTLNARKIFTDTDQNVILYTAVDENETVQVYGIFQNDGEWAEPVRISKYTEDVLGFDAVYDGQKITLVCVTGGYESAKLSLFTWETSGSTDIELEEVYYDGQTLVPEGELVMQAFVKNHSPRTMDGFQVMIQNGGEEVYTGEIEGTLGSGEEDIFDIPYELPQQIDFEQVTLTIMPLAYEDIDMTNNTKDCVLNLTDLSLENASAIKNDDTTKVVVQVVNRGQKDIGQTTTLSFHKNAPDGEVIKTEFVPALAMGNLENIETDISGVEKGDMIYVEADVLPNENLIGNNETQMVVLGDDDFAIEIEQIKADTPNIPDASQPTFTYKTLQDGTLEITGASFSGAKLEIPAAINGVAVTSIGEKAFYGNTLLEELILPDGLKTINARAFSGCSKLKSVSLPDSITGLGIYAFENCTSLTYAKLNAGRINIVQGLFSGCISLKEVVIGNKVAAIRAEAFKGCSSLTTISLPASVILIEKNAFLNAGITKIIYAGSMQSWNKISMAAEGNAALTKATITAKDGSFIMEKIVKVGKRYEIGSGQYRVTAVGSKPTAAYTGPKNKNSKTIKIPNTVKIEGVSYKVTSIDSSAASKCKKLTKVTIGSNVKTISSKAFYNCTKLKTVTIGKNVDTVGNNAFAGCKSLTKITIPAKVTSIGKRAFYGCKKLKAVTIKGKSLDSVGAGAFKGIRKNATIKVPKSEKDYYAYLFKGKTDKKVKIK